MNKTASRGTNTKTGSKSQKRNAAPPRIDHPKVRDDALSANTVDGTNGDSIIQQIYQTIFDSVMGQRLTPGTKLPESALCELFNVGRTVVQKALHKLAHDHIVELRPNRGAIVCMPTPEETRQIFEARRSLESAILALAVKHATKSDLNKLRRQLTKEHAAMHNYAQIDWARLATAFHMRVAELSRNPILQRYLSELLSRCSLIVALHEPSGFAACEHDEHTRIVDYIEQGDTAGAIAAMDEHLQVLEQRIQLVSDKSANSLARMLGMK